MRKHKWLRRIFILALLFVIGMVFLSPERRQGVARFTGAAKEVQAGEKGEEAVVGWMIERIAAGEVDLADESSIRQTLAAGERELGVTLTDENRERAVEFLQTLGNIGVETEDFIEEAKQKYQQYSTEFVEGANEAINEAVESAVSSAAQSFFDSIRQTIEDFFKNLNLRLCMIWPSLTILLRNSKRRQFRI